MPRRSRELPRSLFDALDRADVIFHLGDFTAAEVLESLRQYAPVYAVHGNNDDPDLVSALPELNRVVVNGKEFVLLHGHLGGPTALRAARAVVGGDAVMFGHSHDSHCEVEEGRLLFNPGSPTDRRWARYRSFGVIEVDQFLRSSIEVVP